MTLDEAQAILARVSYKPGFKLSATEAHIHVDGVFLDVTATSHAASFAFSLKVDWDLIHQETQVMHLLHYMIRRWEEHEIDEWLKLDDRRLYDPHACV